MSALMIALRYLVDHVEAASDFYARYLGFAVKEDWGPVVVLERDGIELWLSGPASSAGRTSVDGRKPVPGGANRLVIPVQGLDSKRKELESAGVRVLSDRVSGPTGAWVVVADPAGNPIELFEARA